MRKPLYHKLKKRKAARRKISRRPPPFQVSQILAWMDEFHERTGTWPTRASGRISGSLGETWLRVDQALRKGYRGLPGGSSLIRLAVERRGHRSVAYLPRLTERKILAWADAYHRRTGTWPTCLDGEFEEAPGESWINLDAALRSGDRGLRGGSSLPSLLEAKRGVRNPSHLPPLTEGDLLAWADSHYRRTGTWPGCKGGPVEDAPGETWVNLDSALREGLRGLPGGSSLPDLLLDQRGVGARGRPRLTEGQILEWADAHHERTGHWPGGKSGPVTGVARESWLGIDSALRYGRRGLPGGSSLARLLTVARGVPNPKDLPPLTVRKIRGWIKAHFQRTGQWPGRKSGAVLDAPGETWAGLDRALWLGLRGLPAGTSVHALVQRVARRGGSRPALQGKTTET